MWLAKGGYTAQIRSALPHGLGADNQNTAPHTRKLTHTHTHTQTEQKLEGQPEATRKCSNFDLGYNLWKEFIHDGVKTVSRQSIWQVGQPPDQPGPARTSPDTARCHIAG